MAQQSVQVVSGARSLLSKSNVVQYVGVAASILTFFSGGEIGLNINEQAALVTTIMTVQSVIVWVMHRYYTPHVHAASLTTER